nr:MAG TPA: hypothetical protein [Caudoviricetes sp.]
MKRVRYSLLGKGFLTLFPIFCYLDRRSIFPVKKCTFSRKLLMTF